MRPRTVFEKLAKVKDWPERAGAARYHAGQLVELLVEEARTVRRFFRDRFGRSIQQQLNVFRQCKAEALAKQGMSGKPIAAELNFKQVSHLSQQFKKFHGVSFRVWIKMQS